MESPKKRKAGLIAVLDALGASHYSEKEIDNFLKSRQTMLTLFDINAEGILGGIQKEMVATFTFNDTIIITLRSKANEATFEEVEAFFKLLRSFMAQSIAYGILFRGVVSVGTFHTDEETNTVMGQAVTDAAGWYDKADWFGIHATPKAGIYIQKLLEKGSRKMARLLVDYEVPMTDASKVQLKALNWPKAFYVWKIGLCDKEMPPRAVLLDFLSDYPIPVGVEGKFFHAIAFFDYIVRSQKLDKPAKKPQRAKV